MPIRDYENGAIKYKTDLLTNPDISKENKKELNRFFAIYEVRPATLMKFCRNIGPKHDPCYILI